MSVIFRPDGPELVLNPLVSTWGWSAEVKVGSFPSCQLSDLGDIGSDSVAINQVVRQSGVVCYTPAVH
ncbi:uncharacterized protein METZ01_LOCUS367124 [marine metagenome]|uniref:Uncharacterized protein n=1 Tax=marine metagenome TaxID=408172 RepID=A0A382SWE4_9ZZZZ